MRRAFAEALNKLAADDPQIILVTADLGFQVFDDFQRRFHKRYINVGVAEAQMVTLAAGLALEGWHPIIYSIASFATGRPYEQIRFCLSYHSLPVVIVGAGRGLTYATNGVSHHSIDDISLMSHLPGMTVVIPGDPGEVTELLPQLVQKASPAYISVGRFGESAYHVDARPILGQARLLRDGEGIAIVSTGEVVLEVMAAIEVLRSEGIFPIAYQMHTIKPLDTKTLDTLAEKVHSIIVVEEHLPQGGLTSTIADWLGARGTGPRLIRLGPGDQWAIGNLTQNEFRQRLGYDVHAIAQACRLLLQ